MLSSLALLPLALSLVQGFPTSSSKHYWSGTLEVKANATGKTLLSEAPGSTIVVTEILLQTFAPNSNASQVVGNDSIIDDAIHSNAFIPDNPSTTCFFGVHGLGADSRYWDFSAPGDKTPYSFVSAATAAGYPVFTYDRLGTGQSARPDGVQVVQSSIQVAIAHELINSVRAGEVPHLTCEKIVGIGHSYGSIQVVGVASQFGDADLDAVVLTGFSISRSGQPAALTGLQPALASDSKLFSKIKDTAYWAWSNAIGAHIFFLHFPGASPAAAAQFEANKQTFTFGDIVTLADPVAPSLNFTGPVTVVNGQQDNVFCGGNCYSGPNGTSILLDVAHIFPHARNFSTHVVPSSGHALNVHLSAPSTYSYILEWVASLGL